MLFLSLFLFFIKGWYKDAVFKPISFVVSGILGVIILWNSTLICGALSMKSDISSIQALIEDATASLGLHGNSMVDIAQSNDVLGQAIDSHPILEYYVNYCDFSGHTVAELPTVMCDTLTDYLNGVILKNLLWMLGFVTVGAVVVIKTMGRTYSRSGVRTGRQEVRSDRRTRIASRNSGHKRYSRN